MVEKNGGLRHHKWLITGVYGHLKVAWRGELWDILCALRKSDDTPWLIMGDFNEVLRFLEKWGGCDHFETQIRSFQDMLNDCALGDMGYFGQSFTWYNNREENHKILEWLDLFLANP